MAVSIPLFGSHRISIVDRNYECIIQFQTLNMTESFAAAGPREDKGL